MGGELKLVVEVEDSTERHRGAAPAALAVAGAAAIALGELGFAAHRGVALAPSFIPEPYVTGARPRCCALREPRRRSGASTPWSFNGVWPPRLPVVELWAELVVPGLPWPSLPSSVSSARFPPAASALAAAWAVVPAMALFCRRQRRAGRGATPDGQIRSALRRCERVVRLAARDAAVGAAVLGDISNMDAADAAAEAAAQALLPGDALPTAVGGVRVRRLKDMVYVKEMRAAITSGEFALSLSGTGLPGIVDYQRLCNRLDTFASRLERQPLDREVLPLPEARRLADTLLTTRARLKARLMSVERSPDVESGGAAAAPGAAAAAGAAVAAAAAAAAGATEVLADLPSPRQLLLYLREDKTVDFHFDDALTEANKAAKFSRDLWERLNGRSAHERTASAGSSSSTSAASRPPPESARVSERRRALEEARAALERALRRRCACLERVSQPEAGDRLSRFESERAELLECDQQVRERRCKEVLANIDWLLERAAALLEADLERASVADWDVSGRQLKLLVVEFSLLEKQERDYRKIVPAEGPAAPRYDFTCMLDIEELRVLQDDIADFATRLGLEVDGNERKSFGNVLQRWAGQARKGVEKLRTGVAFYVTGVQLLWQDIQYAASLFSKAAFSNYTLRPREVATLQRTFKDLLTFVPFLIILIIPLTPVGHVMVFSFIQKFFPDFFPSTFTERRQNVVKIYRDIVPESAPGK